MPHMVAVPLPDAPRVIVLENKNTPPRLVSSFLSQSGFQVLAAHSPSEALAGIDGNRCHAMVLDLHVPEPPDTDLVRTIRDHRDPFISHMVIALLSTSPLPSDRDFCMKAGADLFLTKPLPLRDVARLLRGYIRSRFP